MNINRKWMIFIVIIGLAFLLAGTAEAQTETPAQVEWFARYWNNIALSGDPALIRTESNLDHVWGTGSPAPGIGPDRFSARWTAFAFFDAGTYRFFLTSDDGARLWVEDEWIIEDFEIQPATTNTAVKTLTEGEHAIVVEYFENTGEALIQLDWERVGAPESGPGADGPCPNFLVVRPNDTLNRIARLCDTTVAALLQANREIQDPNIIHVGQVLQIPGQDVPVTAITRVNLSLRAEPGVLFDRLDVIPAGTAVPVLGRNTRGDWVLVEFEGQQGWIASWYADLAGRLLEVPVIGT
ncbi:MAG TPA: PA14 domain-containing protein [Anaerolineae bacterium]